MIEPLAKIPQILFWFWGGLIRSLPWNLEIGLVGLAFWGQIESNGKGLMNKRAVKTIS